VPPFVKKVIALLVILVLANAGFVLYGQASFDATFQQLARAFADNNATLPRRSALPSPVEKAVERSGLAAHPYKTVAMQLNGDYFKKPNKPMPMQALLLLRPTPDLLRADRIDANALVTFNALESYHAGRAKMQTMLFGIIPTGEFTSKAFARSELARTLAYGLFNPALLACACVDYRPLDSRHLRATIHDGNLTASVIFESDARGDIVTVLSDDRVRPVKKSLVPTPWRLDVVRYGEKDGLRMPVEVKESWMSGGRPFVYAAYQVTSAKRL